MTEAQYRIRVDGSGARIGQVQVSRSLSQIRRDATRTGRSIDRMGGSFARVKSMALGVAGALGGIGLAGGIAGAVRTIAEFEHTMSAVQAVTRSTQGQIGELTEEARRLGAVSVFSAREAADGMRFLGQAGWNTTQIMAGMEDMLNLAAAGALDLGRASDIASNIMSAFGLEAEMVGDVADTLASVASSANTSVEQLGDAMKFAGPAARAFGLSLEDTATLIGALGQAGLQGSLGGTGLRMVMLNLVKPTDDAASALANYGLTLDDINPATNDLLDVLEKLQDVSVDDAARIFTARALNTFLALQSLPTEIDRIGREVDNRTGRSAEMAAVQMDNLKGDVKSLVSAYDELTLQVGEGGLLGAMRSSTQATTDALRVMAGMDDELFGTKERAEQLISVLEGMGAVAAVIAGRLVLVKGAAIALGLAVSPAAWAVAGVAALVMYRDEVAKTATGVADAEIAISAAYQVITAQMQDASQETAIRVGEMRVSYGELATGAVDALNWIGQAWLDLQGTILGVYANIIGIDMGAIRSRAIEMRVATAVGETGAERGADLGFGMPSDVGDLNGQLAHIAQRNQAEAAREKARQDAINKARQLAASTPDRIASRTGGGAGSSVGSGGPTRDLIAEAREEFEGFRQTIDMVYAAQTQFSEGQALIDAALQRGDITVEQSASLMALLTREYSAASVAANDNLRPIELMVAELQRENEHLQLNAEARSIATRMHGIEQDMRRQGITLAQEERATIEGLIRANEELRNPAPWQSYVGSLQNVGEAMDRSLVRGARSASDAIAGMVVQGRFDLDSLAGALESVAQQMLSLGIQAALFGQGGGGGFGGLLGGLFGGGATAGASAGGSLIPALAGGGIARGGRPHLVGEKGPELFFPGQTGRVVPNGELGGQAVFAPVTHITVQGSGNGGADEEQAARIMRHLDKALDEKFAKFTRRNYRPGGMHNPSRVA